MPVRGNYSYPAFAGIIASMEIVCKVKIHKAKSAAAQVQLRGMVNKRPECRNKSFMLIDSTYLSLSPSE